MSTVCNDQGQVAEQMPDGRVRVVVDRGEACGNCAARGACGALGGRHHRVELVLANRVGAQTGDTVRVAMSETAIIGISAVFYLVPALCLLTGALIGHLLWTGTTDPDLTVAAGAGIGLLAGFALSKMISRAAEKRRHLIPMLEAVVKHPESQKEK